MIVFNSIHFCRSVQLVAQAGNAGGEELQRIMKAKKTTPHIYNINFDPQLSGRIVHILDKPETQIGNGKNKDESEIVMIGPGSVNIFA